MDTGGEREQSTSQESYISLQSWERLSSYESYDAESDDELPDSSVLDKNLNNISITKINTNLLARGKRIEVINDLRVAEKMIKGIIYRRKRKHINDFQGPKGKSPRLDSTKTDVSVTNLSDGDVPQMHDQQPFVIPDPDLQTSDSCKHIDSVNDPVIKAIRLNPKINNVLNEKGIRYKLKLYLVETKKESQFSKLFADMATEKSRESLRKETEVCKSYILFFYRNVKRACIKPEIYALTTGVGWKIVSVFADKKFTKLVERRTLRFPFHHVEYKRDSGHVFKEKQWSRPGHEITFSIWDYLGKLVGKRTRSIRELSSLYATSINAFLRKNGKHISSKVQLTESILKIQRRLSISQFGYILDHFSKICSNEKTYFINLKDNETGEARKEETDDPRFEMHDFMAKVSGRKRIRNLNQLLFKVLAGSMENIDSHIYLSHQSVEKWLLADEFRLYARPLSDNGDTTQDVAKRKRHNRRKIETWFECPSLNAVMLSLREHCGKQFKEEWLDDVIITFRSIKAPLKKCIFSRFSAEEIGTYIYHFGDWIEINAQYLYHIEINFVEMMKEHILEEKILPLVLPWKNPGRNREKDYKVKAFDRKEMEPKWKIHFENVCTRDHFHQVLDEVEQLPKDHMILNFQSLKKKNPQEKAAHLYTLLECNLNEDDYNAAHTLLNMILPDNANTRVLTCDKKTPHGIELCDVLIFNDSTTYLVHVKAGFDGGPIREVCSQIRNAAENIYRMQTIQGASGIIDKYWEILTKDANNPETHENEVKMRFESMTKDKFTELFHKTRNIVFVLACRDTRKTTDFSQDLPQSIEVNMEDKIKNHFKNDKEKSSEIIESLKEEKYLTQQGQLTNQFILDGKSNKIAFKQTLQKMDGITSEETADDVFELLVSALPKSKSTVAKMEIIRLACDFQRYWVGESKLQLKIYKIGTDFPD